jgi:hypothetical protein
MAVHLTIIEPPSSLPAWYPPIDDAAPHVYTLRTVYYRLVIQVLIAIDAIESEEDLTGEAVICGDIAKGLRELVTAGDLPADLFEELRREWNSFQEAMRRQVEARGEVVISGLEPFAYTQQSLKNDLLHFGAFNAIAADHGGYIVG